MKVVVACDSFKGSLPARAVCETLAAALREVRPGLELVVLPLADGGEGTVEAVRETLAGQWVEADVMGPLPHLRVEAGFAWFNHPPRALVEMAAASGLELLRPDQRNPLAATTYGTGELLAAAFQLAAPVFLAVGGSATVDGGVGAAQALGWRFLDEQGHDIGLGGGALERLARVERPPDFHPPPLTVLADVEHVLCGPQGAAWVFGPQKGARPFEVEKLERGWRSGWPQWCGATSASTSRTCPAAGRRAGWRRAPWPSAGPTSPRAATGCAMRWTCAGSWPRRTG